MPVLTPEDHAEWQLWCRFTILKAQRERRRRMRRIDYYPSETAAAIIDQFRRRRVVGGDSSILDASFLSGPSHPEFSKEVLTVIPRILEVHKTGLGYTDADLLKLLIIDPMDMRAMYGVGEEPPRERPRITLVT